MLDYPTWKKAFYWTLCAIFMLAALPSLLSFTSIRWPAALPSPTINLGLDLAGGSHLLLEADTAQVAPENRLALQAELLSRYPVQRMNARLEELVRRRGRHLSGASRCSHLRKALPARGWRPSGRRGGAHGGHAEEPEEEQCPCCIKEGTQEEYFLPGCNRLLKLR